MEWRKTDGGIVDAELLRPRDWVEASHLEAGSIFKVYSTELELSGVAEVMAISECPPLSAGDGEVVTGRFVTRKADETVRLTFETGDTLEGSKSHPIWSPAIQDWVPMEEWTAGDAVLGRDGWMTVTSVEVRNKSVPLYNIEVRGEHVYEVTKVGILVHNNRVCSVDSGDFDVPNNGGRRIIPDGQVDQAATVLGNKFGGQASVRLEGFGNREFDFISGRYIGQTFGGDTLSTKPWNFLSKSRRKQIRETMEAAKATGRQPLFNFEDAAPHEQVLDFINRNAARIGVTPVITRINPRMQ